MRALRVLGFLVPFLLPELVAAQQPSQADLDHAQASFERGVSALRGEDYPSALAAFQESWRLSRQPFVLFNIAMCQQALFDYPAAMASFQEYLGAATDEEPVERIETARAKLAQLETLVATVAMTVSEPEARVLVDGRDVGATPLRDPVRLAPGTHVIEVRKPGFQDLRHEVTVMAGQQTDLVLDLRPTAEAGGGTSVAIVTRTPTGGGTEAFPEIPPPPPEEEESGFFSGPWFWVILGAVVVGGGVTAGVLLWPSEAGSGDDWVVRGR